MFNIDLSPIAYFPLAFAHAHAMGQAGAHAPSHVLGPLRPPPGPWLRSPTAQGPSAVTDGPAAPHIARGMGPDRERHRE